MLVKKVGNGYEFTSPTIDGTFLVKLTLTDRGEEKLNTVCLAVAVSLTPRKLKPGTIRKAIGEERWANFARMKKRTGTSTMFIEPHGKGFSPQTF